MRHLRLISLMLLFSIFISALGFGFSVGPVNTKAPAPYSTGYTPVYTPPPAYIKQTPVHPASSSTSSKSEDSSLNPIKITEVPPPTEDQLAEVDPAPKPKKQNNMPIMVFGILGLLALLGGGYYISQKVKEREF